tara:strand:- start:5293 stop:5559 length:267 start_codon:yes stop_codon:yes gene_type:complete
MWAILPTHLHNLVSCCSVWAVNLIWAKLIPVGMGCSLTARQKKQGYWYKEVRLAPKKVRLAPKNKHQISYIANPPSVIHGRERATAAD